MIYKKYITLSILLLTSNMLFCMTIKQINTEFTQLDSTKSKLSQDLIKEYLIYQMIYTTLRKNDLIDQRVGGMFAREPGFTIPRYEAAKKENAALYQPFITELTQLLAELKSSTPPNEAAAYTDTLVRIFKIGILNITPAKKIDRLKELKKTGYATLQFNTSLTAALDTIIDKYQGIYREEIASAMTKTLFATGIQEGVKDAAVKEAAAKEAAVKAQQEQISKKRAQDKIDADTKKQQEQAAKDTRSPIRQSRQATLADLKKQTDIIRTQLKAKNRDALKVALEQLNAALVKAELDTENKGTVAYRKLYSDFNKQYLALVKQYEEAEAQKQAFAATKKLLEEQKEITQKSLLIQKPTKADLAKAQDALAEFGTLLDQALQKYPGNAEVLTLKGNYANFKKNYLDKAATLKQEEESAAAAEFAAYLKAKEEADRLAIQRKKEEEERAKKPLTPEELRALHTNLSQLAKSFQALKNNLPADLKKSEQKEPDLETFPTFSRPRPPRRGTSK